MSILSDQLNSPEWDRQMLEMGEARVLVHGFLHNGKSQEWLAKALRVTTRIYGKGSEERVKVYMRQIWKDELCL